MMKTSGPITGRVRASTGRPGWGPAREHLLEGFRIGQIEVEPAANVVRVRGELRHLEPRVMDVLVHLAAREGAVVPRMELIDEVWHGALVADEVISRSIYQLRRALDDRAPGEVIQTIPKRGYRLVPPVEVYDAPDVTAGVGLRRPNRWAIGTLLLGLVLAVSLSWPVGRTPPAGLETSPGPRDDAGLPLVVVLPLAGSEPSQEFDHRREAVTNDLIVALANSGVMRVIAPESSVALGAASGDVVGLAAELGIAAMLVGTWLEDGGDAALRLRMIDVGSGEVLWADRFQFELDSAFGIYDRIALAVSEALGQPSGAIVTRLAASRYTENMAAHELYGAGRYYWHRRRHGTLELALDFFRQAATEDPGFLLAWTGQAEALLLLHNYGTLPRDDALRMAELALAKARALHPEAPELHAAEGLHAFFAGDLERSADLLRRALAAQPNAWLVHMWLGRTMQFSGQYRRALASFQRAHELDPLSPIALMNVGMALQISGRSDAALQALEQAAQLDPEFGNPRSALGYARLQRGELAEAVRSFREAISLGVSGVVGASVHAQLAIALLELGLDEEAAWSLDEARRIDPWNGWVIAAVQKAMLERGDLDGLLAFADELRGVAHLLSTADLVAARALLAIANDTSSAALRRLALDGDRDLLLRDADAAWGEIPMLYLALASQREGDRGSSERLAAEAREYLAALRERGMDTPGLAYAEACIASLVGEIDEALERLADALERGWRSVHWATLDPRLSQVQQSAGFGQLVDHGRALLAEQASQLP